MATISPDRTNPLRTPVRSAGSPGSRTAASVWNDVCIDGSAMARFPPVLDWLQNEIGIPIVIDRPEILWRASGLGRAGLVAQLTAPRLATRIAMGIEIPLAHRRRPPARLRSVLRREPPPAHAGGMGSLDVLVSPGTGFVRLGRQLEFSNECIDDP